MNNIHNNGDNCPASNKFNFKYVETTLINGKEISNTEKEWTADNLNDYDKLKKKWQELECLDNHYQLTEVGTLEDGNVSMMLVYTEETPIEKLKFIFVISYTKA